MAEFTYHTKPQTRQYVDSADNMNPSFVYIFVSSYIWIIKQSFADLTPRAHFGENICPKLLESEMETYLYYLSSQ